MRTADDRNGVVRYPWEPMRVSYVGRIDEVLQGGGGKLSLPGGDPGEARKQNPIA